MALGTVGSVFDSAIGYMGQREANRASQASAREQMDFQKMMSDTAHQREVRDLREAGLNPALSANAGASSPVGSSVEYKNPVKDVVGPALSSAMEIKKTMQDINESQSRIDLNKTQSVNLAADADVKKAGVLSKFTGTDFSNFIRRILKSGMSNAKQSYIDWRKERGQGQDSLDRSKLKSYRKLKGNFNY